VAVDPATAFEVGRVRVWRPAERRPSAA